MFVGNDAGSFLNQLISQSADCKNCGEEIIYQEGLINAWKKGVPQGDLIVLCKHCNHFFEVIADPEFKLLDDVTSRWQEVRPTNTKDYTKKLTEKIGQTLSESQSRKWKKPLILGGIILFIFLSCIGAYFLYGLMNS